MAYKSFTDQISELVDLKNGSMETVEIKVVRRDRSSISPFYVGIATLWHGNDHTNSGYLQAHRAEPTFTGESVIKCKFYDSTLKGEYEGHEVIVHHLVDRKI